MKKKVRVIFHVSIGYNDFDHMLPIIYSLVHSQNYHYEIDVIFDWNSVFFLKDDERYKYLIKTPRIKTTDIFQNKYDFIINYVVNLKQPNNRLFNYIHKIIKFIIRKYISSMFDIEKIDWKRLYGLSVHNEKDIIVFSIGGKRIFDIIRKLKKINSKIKYILLPHGGDLCENSMLNIDSLSRSKEESFDFSRWDDMDYIFIQDKKHKNKSVKNGVSLSKLKLVGSARFSKEWIEIKKLIGIDGPQVLNYENKIKILILMPNMFSNIFYDEVMRTIQFIAQYSEVSLKVQYRAGEVRIPKDLKKNGNVDWILSEYSTSALIDWADVAIHAITTMQFECFQKNKVVIFPRYLMANTALCDVYSAGIILKNRDDLRETMNTMVSDFEYFRKKYTSNSHNIDRYLFDYVMAESKEPVLKNYIDSIEELIEKDLE